MPVCIEHPGYCTTDWRAALSDLVGTPSAHRSSYLRTQRANGREPWAVVSRKIQESYLMPGDCTFLGLSAERSATEPWMGAVFVTLLAAVTKMTPGNRYLSGIPV